MICLCVIEFVVGVCAHARHLFSVYSRIHLIESHAAELFKQQIRPIHCSEIFHSEALDIMSVLWNGFQYPAKGANLESKKTEAGKIERRIVENGNIPMNGRMHLNLKIESLVTASLIPIPSHYNDL